MSLNSGVKAISLVLLTLALEASARHGHLPNNGGRQQTPKAPDADEMARVQQKAAEAYRRLLSPAVNESETVMGRRCLGCHESQEPRVRTVNYEVSLNGSKEIEKHVVKIDFVSLDRWLQTDLPALIERAKSVEKLSLSPEEKIRAMTMFHRMGIHFQGEEVKQIEPLREFFARYADISREDVDAYLRLSAPFPGIELRRRITQIYASNPPPTESEISQSIDRIGRVMGIPPETLSRWRREAPTTRFVNDDQIER